MSFFEIESYIDEEFGENFLLVIMAGDVNIHYRVEMENFFNQKLRGNYRDLVVDFSRVEYIDSIGLAVLINVYKKLLNQKKKFYLIGVSNKIKKVFQMSGLDRILAIFPDKASLQRYLKSS